MTDEIFISRDLSEPDGSVISRNVSEIKERIAAAAAVSGRQADEITLVAATKTRSASAVKLAVAAGVDAVGENRVNEMLEKKAEGAYAGAPLHFIGHLQKNKANRAVKAADMIQSVDSAQLAELISRIAEAEGLQRDILLEINIAGEAGKFGFSPGELPGAAEFCARLPGVRVKGLMAIPPIAKNPGDNDRWFSEMQKLFVDIRSKKYDNIFMEFLSMGMSDDFESAVSFGSNVVRIGSAIFGRRPPAPRPR